MQVHFKQITQKELARLFNYNEETGILSWAVDRKGKAKKGHRSGYKHACDGYRYVGVNYKLYREHRLIWCLVYGYFPENDLDHKNGRRDDNRLKNLREVSKYCNNQNISTPASNKTGFIGVSFFKRTGKWRAVIQINYNYYHLGLYPTPLEAALARYTVEVQCPQWTCNYRSELVKAIKMAWPEFNHKQ